MGIFTQKKTGKKGHPRNQIISLRYLKGLLHQHTVDDLCSFVAQLTDENTVKGSSPARKTQCASRSINLSVSKCSGFWVAHVYWTADISHILILQFAELIELLMSVDIFAQILIFQWNFVSKTSSFGRTLGLTKNPQRFHGCCVAKDHAVPRSSNVKHLRHDCQCCIGSTARDI